MKKKRALTASRDPSFPGTVLALRGNEPEAGNIVFHAGTDIESSEMLKITKTGFYVRGKPVEQDEKEAALVYNAFREWMTWAALRRQY
jgi:hypothetical protein